ncbi:glycoside hydrolase family 95-like protein [Cohnella sp.]|uniref:glycoside hydrolase family 95-like protein n=1 Tax=Cohnella sp. TaxID=1883426 RepID=UPI003561B113
MPKAWANGAVSGLKARGGWQIDMKWQNGLLTEAAITASYSQACRVRVEAQVEASRRKVNSNRVSICRNSGLEC